jgi:Fe2+ transport system protein FeoA
MSAAELVTCAMCGFDFDPAEGAACASCPLGAHCALSCCPACGYSTLDHRSSRAARLALRLLGRRGRRAQAASRTPSLADAGPGSLVRVARVELPSWRRARLAAYGVAPGRDVDVVQTSPLVIIRVEHVELALERELARAIDVTRLADEGVV